MDFSGYIFTKEKIKCTGCGSCVNACSQNALSMQADGEGFLYPLLDENKCIKCGACERACPWVNNRFANKEQNQSCYIATTLEELYYRESASIGICTMLSEEIIKRGGMVYGAFLDENNWLVYHICVQDDTGIQKIRNSKYLQSDTKDTFKEVQINLKGGKSILYIGTPCQIAGLKAYLKKEYNNLFTVDIMCHGVFSPKLLKYEVEYWRHLFRGEIKNFKFRSKLVYKRSNGGMVNFDCVKGKNSYHIERFAGSSPSYRCYAYSGDGISYNLRPSCYSCSFREGGRYGDICVGDPWKVSDLSIKNNLLRSSNPIRSLFMVNTPQGNEMFKSIKKYLIFEEIERHNVFKQSALLPTKQEIPSKRNELYERLEVEEYGALVERLLECNLKQAHKRFVYTYNLTHLKEIVKRLIKRQF